ncbi:MAG: serine hydrolase [Chthoniobacterales bacterium]|nr:serine hydrolase [Chthoniobacterales bacterium]
MNKVAEACILDLAGAKAGRLRYFAIASAALLMPFRGSAALLEDNRRFQPVIDEAAAAGLPGVQAFVRQGTARWSGTAGFASIEMKRRMSSADRLRLASLTKMMTSAVTLELVKLGRFKLEDRAVALLPPGALNGIPHAEKITVAHLLDHTSGLHNFNGDDSRDFFRELYNHPRRGRLLWTSAELLSFAKKPEHSATGRPGEKKSYSSTGYIVLEMILEHREGKPFADLFREHLFAPLQMNKAGVEGIDLQRSDIADSYARPERSEWGAPSPFADRKEIRPDGLVNLSAGLDHYNAWARAAGAVAANAEDLGQFMDAVTTGRFSVMTNQQAQFAAATLRPGAMFDWNGGSRGIQTTILYEPHRNLTVVVLTNASNAGPSSHDLARQLLTVARGDNDLRTQAHAVLRRIPALIL